VPEQPERRRQTLLAVPPLRFHVVERREPRRQPVGHHPPDATPRALRRVWQGACVAPALWVIERGPAKVFLFGETVGIRSEHEWLTSRVVAALEASHEFWCEVADAEDVARSPLLAEYGLSSTPLRDRLTEEQQQRVRAAADTLGMEQSALDGLRPWLAGQFLEHAARAAAGVDPTLGVHEVLVQRARAAGKSVRGEFFDADAALAFFGGLPAPIEVDYLLWTVDRAMRGRPLLDAQADAWCRGDGSVVAHQVSELRATYPALHDVLLTERNGAWVPRIDAALDDPAGAVFLLVGDSHLPGDDGLLALLPRAGMPLTLAG
jgi:uncharacterized protein YbaP (TraB family)